MKNRSINAPFQYTLPLVSGSRPMSTSAALTY